jgi:hypothetical protein
MTARGRQDVDEGLVVLGCAVGVVAAGVYAGLPVIVTLLLLVVTVALVATLAYLRAQRAWRPRRAAPQARRAQEEEPAPEAATNQQQQQQYNQQQQQQYNPGPYAARDAPYLRQRLPTGPQQDSDQFIHQISFQ